MNAPLSSCPQDGHGRHAWLIRAARKCRSLGIQAESAFDWLRLEMARTGEANVEDVRRAVQYIFKSPVVPRNVPAIPAPRFTPIRIQGNDADLRRLHAETDWTRAPQTPARFVDAVLSHSRCICTGSSPDRTTTVFRQIATDDFLRSSTLIVPNPMAGLLAKNKAGDLSNRCESLVQVRTYQVIEYDLGSLEDQAARILHLRDSCRVPLRAVVFSGKKSLHAWFDVRALTPEQQTTFFTYGVQATGADPSHRSPVQLTRLPFAVRPDTGAVQSLVHFKF